MEDSAAMGLTKKSNGHEFLPHKDLSKYSMIKTALNNILEEVVDCITYLKLSKI
jgi:hypothetical protein